MIKESFWNRFQTDIEDRFSGFKSLMPFRVQEILLVASAYDAFTLEEGGRFTELLLHEYRELNLSFAPHVTQVSTGEEALKLIKSRRYDLVLTMTRLGGMNPKELACSIKKILPEMPVIALSFHPKDLSRLTEQEDHSCIDRFFLWAGDARLLLAIIKNYEDRRNIDHDTQFGEVRAILLIEDSVRFYSSYLPLLYTEVLHQTTALMQEGLNLSHQLLRMRARPKILLAEDYEEAWALFSAYSDYLLGVISDAQFPWQGKKHPAAGLEFIRRIKEVDPHLPAVIQSSDAGVAADAKKLGAGFINKNSRQLLNDIRTFMLDNFGFGDFVFKHPNRTEIARAPDLRSLKQLLKTVPEDSIRYHASRDHFSNWLRARTEFGLASLIRPRKVSEFKSIDELRRYLITTINRFREETQRGIVTDFSRQQFDESSGFVRIGGGSLGGKARGLAFMNSVLYRYGVVDHFPGIKIHVPPTAVIGTDVFDSFLGKDNIGEQVLGDAADEDIKRIFLEHKIPSEIYADLETFLNQVKYPLAVRSSSLLEDSQYQPFAGVYDTYMLANNHPDVHVRLDQLCDAIKLVYASTFFHKAKAYLEATSNRIEEEKMAVIIQQVIGHPHEHYYYPDFSGVAYSTNYYPTVGLKPEEGIASVALGLGKTVVEGRKSLRFSPKRPGNLPQFSTTKDMLDNSQREYFAIDTSHPGAFPKGDLDFNLALLNLEDAERQGTLEPFASVYSRDNDAVYDGIWREGPRLVTFAHILKSNLFPLSEVLDLLLELGTHSMSCPVDIEFAVVLGKKEQGPHQFGFLQIRPMVGSFSGPEVPAQLLAHTDALCKTSSASGNGHIDGLYDLVYVPKSRFDRGKTLAIAQEIGKLNFRLKQEGRPYMLLGPGRWGTADRWLGIPVRWDQINGAQVIVETDFEDLKVIPSQGSHFYQNLISFQVGYLTVNQSSGKGHIDWNWLDAQPAASEGHYLRHLRLDQSLQVFIDGKSGQAVVLKPGADVRQES